MEFSDERDEMLVFVIEFTLHLHYILFCLLFTKNALFVELHYYIEGKGFLNVILLILFVIWLLWHMY
jgi:hypothetical protein